MKHLILTVLALLTLSAPALAGDKSKESAYDRVMRTGTIRCGYFVYPPGLVKDPNTGEFSGIYYDYMMELGKSLSLKIDWAEEIGFGDYPAALQSGRVDAMCGGTWITSERARTQDFVMPVYYLPMYGYSRVGDTRFDKDVSILNDPKYTIAILEGGATSTIQRHVFPESKVYELPQLTSPAELFISLDMKKADAVIYDPFTFQNFNAKNPDKIRQIPMKPLKVFASAVPVNHGETELRQMLSYTTLEMHLSGKIEAIIKKYEKFPGTVFRAAKPYQDPAQ